MGSYPYSNIRQPRRKTTLLQKVSQLLGLTRFHSYSDPYKLGLCRTLRIRTSFTLSSLQRWSGPANPVHPVVRNSCDQNPYYP